MESGRHLWNCLAYVDMNMVRAGEVTHLAEREWCGYREVAGVRCRYPFLDRECIVEKREARDIEEVKEARSGQIEARVEGERFARESKWR